MKKTLVAVGIAALALSSSMNAFAGGSIEAGKALVEKNNCASCHGKDYNTPIDPSYPKLAGQHADYIAHALHAYQRGGESKLNDNGRSNAIMGGMAKALKPQEIKDIAAYLQSLPGSLVLRR